MNSSSTALRGSVESALWTKERLDSWKEVASFFRREVRTVQLWEKSEGLPVRRQRHKKLGSVYAYRQELEAWWAARSAVEAPSAELEHRSVSCASGAQLPAAQLLSPAKSRCRLIAVPFEPVHSPLDKGPRRQIVERFAEGLKNDLVIELVQLHYRPIILPRRDPVFAAAPMVDLMRKIAREYEADLLLNGSIRYSGNQVRVSVQLIRASDILCLWSGRFDTALDSMLAAQAELAQRIACSLPQLERGEYPARENALAINRGVAFHACTMGFYYWQRRGRSALGKAISYFEDAIELEPGYADAYAGLADTYVSLSYNHLMPAMKAAEKARDAVEAALKLDRNSVKVRNALINMLMHCSWNLSAAEHECRELLDAGMHDVRTLQLYSSLMNLRGRHQEAINLALHAYRIEPESDLVNGQLSLAYFYAGDYGSALSYVLRTIHLEPQFLMGYALLGRTEAELGNWDEAIKAFQRGLGISSQCPFLKALLAYAYAGRGDASAARELLRELEEQSEDDCFPAYDVSAVHAILNQENEALQKINKAYSTRDMKTIFMPHDPRFTRLRDSPVFKQITLALSDEAESLSDVWG